MEAKIARTIQWKLILQTVLFAVVMTALIAVYIYFQYNQEIPTKRLINQALSESSLILIGLSFALSGIAFFWDILDSRVRYRKYLGLVGFGIGVVHTLLSLTHARNPYAYIPALVAVAIFLVMTRISTVAAQRSLLKYWRPTLRFGYVAYLLLIVHEVVLRFAAWRTWLLGGELSLPPFSLITVILACGVVVLRIALFVAVRKKQAGKSPTQA